MLKIGCHLSTSKGYCAMGLQALEIGANTFQFFSRNPRGSRAKAVDPSDTNALMKLMIENDFTKILAHAPYTLNISAATEDMREFAKIVLAEDLARMEYLPENLYNFHPGSHVGQGIEAGIMHIINTLNEILKPDQNTIVLLETMAGKGSEIGSSFEELKVILDGVVLNNKLGVCLDTCHIYDAGYDIVNNLDGVLDAFDRIIGLDRLYAIHLNDSKNPFASHKDRHEKIGDGALGFETMVKIINHPKLRHLPFFLETPNEIEGYAREIQMLKEAYTG